MVNSINMLARISHGLLGGTELVVEVHSSLILNYRSLKHLAFVEAGDGACVNPGFESSGVDKLVWIVLKRRKDRKPGGRIGLQPSEVLNWYFLEFQLAQTCNQLAENVLLNVVSINIAIGGWTVFIRMSTSTSYTTLLDRFYGCGSLGFLLSISIVLHIFLVQNPSVVRAATSGEIPGVDEFELTMQRLPCSSELRTLDLLSIILKHSRGILSKKCFHPQQNSTNLDH
ncbi:hypothetical protein Tco_0563270 [Tanacetum coccineum]